LHAVRVVDVAERNKATCRNFFLNVVSQVAQAPHPFFAGHWSAELAFGRDGSTLDHGITQPRLNRVTLGEA
jgi:hypothetical protein